MRLSHLRLISASVAALVLLLLFTSDAWLPRTDAVDGGASWDEATGALERQVDALVRVLSPLGPSVERAGASLTQVDTSGEVASARGGGASLGGASVLRYAMRTPLSKLRAVGERLGALTAALRREQPAHQARGGEETGAVADAAPSLIELLLDMARGAGGGLSAPGSLLPEGAAAEDEVAGGAVAGAVPPGCPPVYGFLKPSPCACTGSRAPSAAVAKVANLRPRAGGLVGYDRSPQPQGDAWFLTYGDAAFARSRERLAVEARAFTGVFAQVRAVGREYLLPAWARAHAKLLNESRGGGYWVWKPHIMLRLLHEEMVDGDVLLYADAGCTFVANPAPYLELAAQHGLVLFRNAASKVQQWTKGYTFAALGLDPAQWGEERMVAGGIIALQKRPWVMELLERWEHLMVEDPDVVNDVDTSARVADHKGFKAHRHDQSVLSLLGIKHGVFMAPYLSWPKERALIIFAARREG